MIKILIVFMSFMAVMQKGCGQVSTSDSDINKNLDCTNCTSKDSAITKKLSEMNFYSYKGKEDSLFLDDLGYEYERYIRHQKKPGYIWKIIFRYTDSLSVDIRVSNLGQTKPLDVGYTFNIEEFKKKKISVICFRYGGRCIKGCKDEPCYD
jgi:hypothetical protein